MMSWINIRWESKVGRKAKLVLKGERITLRDKRLADAANDYRWKSDVELAYLDATLPVLVDFSAYLAGYVMELDYFACQGTHFAIETIEGKHIGNCMYYHLDKQKQEAELGILIGERDYWDKGYGSEAVAILVDYIFRENNLNRIYLHTIKNNSRAQRCFQKCHFVPCGNSSRDGYHFIEMELCRRDWEKYGENFVPTADT
jgi:RimJ/RimL family protein N-acetyltransferase